MREFRLREKWLLIFSLIRTFERETHKFGGALAHNETTLIL